MGKISSVGIKRSREEDIKVAKKVCSALRDGRQDEFVRFYKEWHQPLVSYARRRLLGRRDCYDPEEDAREIVSEFWKDFINKRLICSYEGKSSLKTYLESIVARKIVDFIKSTRREYEVTLSQTKGLGVEDASNEEERTSYSIHPDAEQTYNSLNMEKMVNTPYKTLESLERVEELRRALDILSAYDQPGAKIIYMRLKGYSYREIADALDVSEVNARQRFRRAILRLRKIIAEPTRKELCHTFNQEKD